MWLARRDDRRPAGRLVWQRRSAAVQRRYLRCLASVYHAFSARTRSTSAKTLSFSGAVISDTLIPLRTIAAISSRSSPNASETATIVLVDVTAEIGGIVGIDRHDHALVHHPPQRMVPEIIDDPQPQIGQRTHGQRDLVAGQPPHQCLILQRTIAVIDAGDAEHVERFPDVARRALPRRHGPTERSPHPARGRTRA